MTSTVETAWRNSLGTGMALIRSIAHGVFVIRNLGRKKIVPAVTNPLLLTSATALAAEIREGQLKSEDLVRCYIERIHEVEPYINAVADERFAVALEEAKAVDALVASRSIPLDDLARDRPLLGVPFSVKMLLSVKGLSCTAGCVIFRDRIAEEDAESVASMKNAGAICICVTNSPEFGLFYETYNNVHGKTSNPYDTTRTSGGSSGGEGALIGAAGSVFGLGNDLGGSVRYPAFYNCIFSHKPTAGIISNHGTFPFPYGKLSDFLAVGPMCRYAEDLATTMKILAGPKSNSLGLGELVNLHELKIRYMVKSRHILAPHLDDDVLKSIKQVMHYFENNYGINPEEIEVDEMKHASVMWVHLCRAYAGDNAVGQLTCNKSDLRPTLEIMKSLVGCSDYTLAAILTFNLEKFPFLYKKSNVPKMLDRLKLLDKVLSEILDDRTVLFLPTFAKTAIYHHEWLWSSWGVGYMAAFNMLGYPVTQCALGLNNSGLPLGLQVVGGKGKDNLTMAVAMEIERAFGGWVPPGSSQTQIIHT